MIFYLVRSNDFNKKEINMKNLDFSKPCIYWTLTNSHECNAADDNFDADISKAQHLKYHFDMDNCFIIDVNLTDYYASFTIQNRYLSTYVKKSSQSTIKFPEAMKQSSGYFLIIYHFFQRLGRNDDNILEYDLKSKTNTLPQLKIVDSGSHLYHRRHKTN